MSSLLSLHFYATQSFSFSLGESIGRGQTDTCHSLGVGGIQGSWARFNQAQIQRTRLGRVHQMEFNS